jgi:hypothetical protein
LDRIFVDLWGTIIDYTKQAPFIVGQENHLGYRKLTKDNYYIYEDRFWDYYLENFGILCKDVEPLMNCVGIDNYRMHMSEFYISCRGDNAKNIFYCEGIPINKRVNVKIDWTSRYAYIANIMMFDGYFSEN